MARKIENVYFNQILISCLSFLVVFGALLYTAFYSTPSKASVGANFPVIFSDLFSTNKGWTKTTSTGSSASIINGEYSLRNNIYNKETRVLAPVLATSIPNIYRVKVSARRVTGTSMEQGIIFQYIASNKFNLFKINPSTKTYSLMIYDGTDGWKTLKSGSSSYIASGSNQLEILHFQSDDRVKAYINNYQVFDFKHKDIFKGGKVGLFMKKKDNNTATADARFDNFYLMHYVDMGSPPQP